MKTKNLFGFFMAIASILLIVATVSATTPELAVFDSVKINGINELGSEDISVVAGESITIEVIFTALEDASDVKLKAELEGDKTDVETELFLGDIEEGKRYTETFTLRVPYELKDEVSTDLSLNMKIWNGDYRTDYDEIVLRTQRPSYNVAVMSISTSQTVEAGELFPINVVLKNVGYNHLDDLYVTIKLPTLGVEKTVYAGDLYAVENNDDDEEDTLSLRAYLRIPYEAQSGIYNLEVEVMNDDLTISAIKQITVNNDFSNYVIVNDYSKMFATGEQGVYNLLIVNPTNTLKVFRIMTESPGSLSTSVSEAIVAVSPGTSKTVQIFAEAQSQGQYTFDVKVLSGDEIVESVTLSANVQSGVASSAVVVLTIVLLIIFLVLLVILIVLLRKKPEKADDFGESYY